MSAAANPTALPDSLEAYRQTPTFTPTTLPSALAADHSTKAGVWGTIQVEHGRLRYRITDPRRVPFDTVLTPDTPPGIVEPEVLHQVQPIGDVGFHVVFHRQTTEERK